MISISPTQNSRLLNEIVEAFESSRLQDADVAIDEFLPEQHDPEYARIALELMRVDMEHSWRNGEPKSLDDYKRRFNDVLSDQVAFRELAFEDYRQKLLRGKTIRRDEYAQFGINTNGWPEDTSVDQTDDSTNAFGTVDSLSSEFDRLVESIQEYPVEGQRFGPYEIVSQIGQGAFARVYLARQADLANRLVVLKVGSPTTTEHEKLARLQHTNIVPIHSVQEIDGLSVLCMPFFGLATLADILQTLRTSKLPPKSAAAIPRAQADKRAAGPASTTEPVGASAIFDKHESHHVACVKIMRRVADALCHANERGILHRDLKPANILLADDGQPMLLDFNVSGEVISSGTASLTVGGTLPYMSPEQMRSVRTGETIDARSDIYSFGVVFFELLTGVHPFTQHQMGAASTVQPCDARSQTVASSQSEQSINDSLNRILAERESSSPNVRTKNPTTPLGLANIVHKCLCVDANDRYRSAQELRDDLRNHEEHMPLRFTPQPPVSERLAKWRRRHPQLASNTAIAVFASVLLIAVGMFAFSKVQESETRQAINVANDLHQTLPSIRATLTSPDQIDEAIGSGRDAAQSLIATATERRYADRLDQERKTTFHDDVNELQFLLAHAKRTPDSDSQIDLDSYRLSTASADRRDVLTAIDDMLAGNADRAIPVFKAIVDREPFNLSHRQVLANCYLAAGQIADADEAYSVCVSLDGNSFLAHFNRGRCRLDTNRFDDAIDDFDRAVELQPMSPECLINRSLAYKGIKEYKAAERDLTKAIEIEPDWSRVYFMRARVRKLLENTKGESEDIAKGFATPPQTERDWIARGIALLQNGPNRKSDPDGAIHAFEEALRLNPFSRSALRNIGHVISEHRHNNDAALEMLDRVVQISPGYTDDVVSRAVLHARMGKSQSAIDAIEEVLSNRRDGKTVIQAACVYALVAAEKQREGNDTEETERLINRSVSLVGEAITMDGRWLSVAANDPDLAAIRNNRNYKSIVATAGRFQRAVQNADRANLSE
ncbi:MAG: protein kinase [Planctomycetales bacterium]|nr:protein kinase [Planctomycetales bacterium]